MRKGMTKWTRKSLLHAEGDNEASLVSSKIHNRSAGPIPDREDGFRDRNSIAVPYQSTFATFEAEQIETRILKRGTSVELNTSPWPKRRSNGLKT
jgi:hypothetical protein